MLGTTHMRMGLVMCVLLSVFLSGGCIMTRDCREFFALPRVDQKAKFKSYSIQEQVDLYICGQYMEPPQVGLAYDIAEGGEAVIPYLVQRLQSEKDESRQEKIIYIFRALSLNGHLKNRPNVIDQIEQLVSAMKDDFYKTRSRQMLDDIKTENPNYQSGVLYKDA